MSSFRKAVNEIAKQAGGDGDPHLHPCRHCDTQTAWATLSALGGLCRRCFEGYCDAGIRGGVDGFQQNAPDTPQQAEMRRHLKANRPTGQRMAEVEDDAAARDRAKADAARKVAEYARRTGHATGTDTRARGFGGQA